MEELIGEGFKKDAMELEKLAAFAEDAAVLERLVNVKWDCKLRLKNYLKQTQGIELNENSIFDIQIKRLHEYKRQQMNALYIIHKYFEIKEGKKPTTPITVIFGAKAAPAYIIAKDIIHLGKSGGFWVFLRKPAIVCPTISMNYWITPLPGQNSNPYFRNYLPWTVKCPIYCRNVSLCCNHVQMRRPRQYYLNPLAKTQE